MLTKARRQRQIKDTRRAGTEHNTHGAERWTRNTSERKKHERHWIWVGRGWGVIEEWSMYVVIDCELLIVSC